MEKETWFVMEEIPNSHFLMTVRPQMWFADTDKKISLPRAGAVKVITKEEKGIDELIYVREKFALGSQVIFEKILTDLKWAFQISEFIEKSSLDLMKLSEKVRKTNVQKLSNQELGELFEEWSDARGEAHGSGMPWNILEYEDQKLSRYLTKWLDEQIAKVNYNGMTAPEVFSLLSTPTCKTFAKKEEEDILFVALQAKAGKDVALLIEKHWEKYCWLAYMYEGPAWTREYFEQILAGLAKMPKEELEEKCNALKRYDALIQARQKELRVKLKIDEKHKNLLQLAQSIIYGKALRKDAIYHAFWCSEDLFKECAKRLNITVKQFRRFMPWEVKPALEKSSCDANELNQRYAFSIFYYSSMDKNTPVIYTGEKARQFYASLKLPKIETTGITELKGDCACPGNAVGTVKIINTAGEMGKMNDGDIIVSMATTPDIVPAMKRAAAIVTDMGGMTCHAAIVSRELSKPCVIGTKIATKTFKDGDKVEVNAAKGVIKKV